MSSVQATPRGIPLLAFGAVLVFATACSPSDGVLDPSRPNNSPPVQLAKGGNGGGGGGGGGGDPEASLTGSVIAGDFSVNAGQPTPLESTCPTGVKVGQWHLDFGPSGCLLVTLDWNTDAQTNAFANTPYTLTDDVKLIVQKESGKNGRITHVRLLGQDVAGGAGMGHSTDLIPVSLAVAPDKTGFTLHVHAVAVPVYRLDSHLFGGNRVALIGWVSIGDAVYSTQ